MSKQEHIGKRKKRSSAPTRIPDLGHYYIVTDTKETEKNYIYGLRDSLPSKLQGRIAIEVSQAKTKNLVETCKEKSSLHPQYSQPWIILDRDKVQNFDEIISLAEKYDIAVGWSNPCIETWFSTYFGDMSSCLDSVSCCHNFSQTFEKKTQKEYDKANKQIYEILNRYGDEKQALHRAELRLQEHLKRNTTPSNMYPCTTVHRLVDEIKEKTKDQ